jgi:translin
MQQLDEIIERIRQSLDARNAARDQALSHARTLTRYCSQAIRAIHREESGLAQENLEEARQLANALRENLLPYPDLYYAGYTQDALKEFVEASVVYALLSNENLPGPEDLSVEDSTYLKGLAEAAGELRRKCLDILRNGHSGEAERLLNDMDEIYSALVTMDYPDALTGGLRRLTDLVRGVTERTRGDMTLSLRQEQLEQSMRRLEAKLK